jgi:hypothetical protein
MCFWLELSCCPGMVTLNTAEPPVTLEAVSPVLTV